MTDEQKKIALVAVVGGAAVLVLYYLYESESAASAAAQAQPAASTAATPLQLPAGSQITYNFPGLAQPVAATAPSCTTICDTCDDNTAYAGVASYRTIPEPVLQAQYRAVAGLGVGPTTPPVYPSLDYYSVAQRNLANMGII